MKKVIFIIPYFGNFNNYFQLFLNSCKCNEDYNWLIFTDDKSNYNFPKNVKKIEMNLKEVQKLIERKLSFSVNLTKAYKLCDFKPLYGYIFEEYIKDFSFWGYCDNDLIFGNIKHFIDLDKLYDYDKIGVLGHFTLFKNTPEIRKMFLLDNRYLEVVSSEKSMKFDEEYGEDFGTSINNIFEKNGKKILALDSFADIYVKSSHFKLTHYLGEGKGYLIEKKDKSFFVWDNGNLYKIICKNGNIIKKEYMYIHLQKRKMKMKISGFHKSYKIIPNEFAEFSAENLLKEKRYSINLHYFRIRFKNLKNKIKDRRNK
jgi:hypothetical protein